MFFTFIEVKFKCHCRELKYRERISVKSTFFKNTIWCLPFSINSNIFVTGEGQWRRGVEKRSFNQWQRVTAAL